VTRANEAGRAAAPVIDRPITLTFQGDWGQANMHRICGWLAQEIGDRCPPGSRFGIWSGRGGADAFAAVLDGVVDIAIATPTAAGAMLIAGSGPLTRPGADRLRALGTLPQRDRLVVCADASLGLSRIGDLAAAGAAPRIATSPDDGVNLIGLAAHQLLTASGADPAGLAAAGAAFSYHERPFTAIAEFARGEANVLIHEAIMMPAWQRVADARPVSYLPVSPEAAATFAAWDWPTAVVPAGYLPGLDRDLTTLEFSDFLVACRDDLPDDVARLAAWCMVATRRALEVQYQHFPPDHSPVTHPLDPTAIATTVVPLHPAAAQAYRQLGDFATSDALIWV
jgi:TRAP-type uncharacterized transport system substrate-binding protein